MEKRTGILICGPNGSGKSTLGRALAGALGYRLMDTEDYYFPDPEAAYTVSRTRDEVRTLLLADMDRYAGFVMVSVNGDWGEEINTRYDLVVWLSAPSDLRLTRVRQRTLDRFGERALPGGDLYEQEEAFHAF
ncbi:MAG: AAA family ATPase, partial [Clostridia bacterium]|nr:AAA family ATPase [Clostridia bacterium]